MTTATAAETTAVEFFRAKLQFETTPHTLKYNLEQGKVFLIDVRDAESFAKERIPGAANFPLTELEKSYSKLPQDKTLVTYCWNITCAMATKAALQLAEKGFKVQELMGGLDEFRKKFPTEGTAIKK